MTASLPDALRQALGQVVAEQRRQWHRERELIEAQAGQTIAELRTAIVELRQTVNDMVSARLASLKDGEPGASVTTTDVAPMIAAEVARAVSEIPKPKNGEPGPGVDMADIRAAVASAVAELPPAPAGRDADPELIRQMVAEATADLPQAVAAGRDADQATIQEMVQRAVAELPLPKDGQDGTSVGVDDLLPFVATEVAKAVAALPAPKDGEPGRDADPAHIAEMVAAAVAEIPPAPAGKDVDIAVVREMIASEVAKLPPATPGRDADPEMIREMVQAAVAALPPAAPGEPGKEGPPGKLPLIKAWSDVVHYEGDVVAHSGGAYQAARDTGREPPHDDWRCIASAGRDGADGRSFNVRSTWSQTEIYAAMDVVALNGASFVARRDDPGACPGEGWQMIAAQGKRGQAGDSVKGDPGKRGDPGLPVANIDIDGQALLTITNGDGSTVICDLYPLLSKLQ